MLGKLLKYDLRSILRQFLPVWILAPVVAVILGLSMSGTEYTFIGNILAHSDNETLAGIMILVFVSVMIALFVMTVLFVIQRFWNGLLKEEGYLMFTLPAETWELVTAKGLAATLVTCISILVGMVSGILVILISTSEILRAVSSAWRSIVEVLIKDTYSPYYWMTMILWILIGIFSVAKSIYQVYASMAVGHLFEKHRVAGACIAYVGISVILSVIGSLCMGAAGVLFDAGWMNDLMENAGVWYVSVRQIFVLLLTIVQLVIFHVVTERILDTRLNLE